MLELFKQVKDLRIHDYSEESKFMNGANENHIVEEVTIEVDDFRENGCEMIE